LAKSAVERALKSILKGTVSKKDDQYHLDIWRKQFRAKEAPAGQVIYDTMISEATRRAASVPDDQRDSLLVSLRDHILKIGFDFEGGPWN
jgi:hypothetical protein